MQPISPDLAQRLGQGTTSPSSKPIAKKAKPKRKKGKRSPLTKLSASSIQPMPGAEESDEPATSPEPSQTRFLSDDAIVSPEEMEVSPEAADATSVVPPSPDTTVPPEETGVAEETEPKGSTPVTQALQWLSSSLGFLGWSKKAEKPTFEVKSWDPTQFAVQQEEDEEKEGTSSSDSDQDST